MTDTRLRLVFSLVARVILCVVAAAPSLYAQGGNDHPFDGSTFLTVEGGIGYVTSETADGVIPPVDPAISLGGLRGSTRTVAVSLERPMPRFFKSRGVTLKTGLLYRSYEQSLSGTGEIVGIDDGTITATQRTTMTAEYLAATLLLRIHTVSSPQRWTPTVDFGFTLGHLLDVSWATDSEPLFSPKGSNDGFPASGVVPNRRFFHGTIDLGLGMAIALGKANQSVTLVPALGLHAALGSFTLDPGEEIIPFVVDATLGIRVPLSSMILSDE